MNLDVPLIPIPFLPLRQQRGLQDWESPQELLNPLRAINGLPLLLGPMQQKAAKDMESKRPAPRASPVSFRQSSPLPMAADLTMSMSKNTSLTRGVASAAADAASKAVDASGGRKSPSSPSREGLEEEEEEEEVEGDDDSREDAKGEADIGLMALWGLMNMSDFSAAQVNNNTCYLSVIVPSPSDYF